MYDIDRLSDEQLLLLRLCDVTPPMEESVLAPYIEALYEELAAAGLGEFRPKVYAGDEWYCPEGTCAISVPFYLTHPRLLALEKRFGEPEGAEPEELMRLLRHEAGHAFEHAYGLARSREWRSLFGSARQVYRTENYSAVPLSRDYVHHLEGYYAQTHPCEDFAETFATWLDPHSQWEVRYRSWPRALSKLRYVAQMVLRCRGRRPAARFTRPLAPARRSRRRLLHFYQRRLQL